MLRAPVLCRDSQHVHLRVRPHLPIAHHPLKETKQAYLRGSLGPGASLVVTCHLQLCPVCALEVEALHDVDGFTASDLARRGGGLPDALKTSRHDGPSWAPPALAVTRIGRWRWAGPGLRLAWLRRSAGLGECLYLLRAESGVKMPMHGHTGPERLIVLEGACNDDGRIYTRGDVAESDEREEHQLATDPETGCICLIAADGPVRLQGLTRLLQPLLGI
jgi:putative transcriptional regulator